MVRPGQLRRGEILLLNLDPTAGSEIHKAQPCVAIAPPEAHDCVGTAIIAQMTAGSNPAPLRIAVRHAGKKGLIPLDRKRAVDKVRLVKRYGVVDHASLRATLAALGEMLAG